MYQYHSGQWRSMYTWKSRNTTCRWCSHWKCRCYSFRSSRGPGRSREHRILSRTPANTSHVCARQGRENRWRRDRNGSLQPFREMLRLPIGKDTMATRFWQMLKEGKIFPFSIFAVYRGPIYRAALLPLFAISSAAFLTSSTGEVRH
jgi:hypothetical protein